MKDDKLITNLCNTCNGHQCVQKQLLLSSGFSVIKCSDSRFSKDDSRNIGLVDIQASFFFIK